MKPDSIVFLKKSRKEKTPHKKSWKMTTKQVINFCLMYEPSNMWSRMPAFERFPHTININNCESALTILFYCFFIAQYLQCNYICILCSFRCVQWLMVFCFTPFTISNIFLQTFSSKHWDLFNSFKTLFSLKNYFKHICSGSSCVSLSIILLLLALSCYLLLLAWSGCTFHV